jgi:hypothetical protein
VKHPDGSTLPYSGPNLATMLSGVTDPAFVHERVDVKGNPYPFTPQARNQSLLQQTLKLCGISCYQILTSFSVSCEIVIAV